jgi:hypothetical protein
MSPASNEIIAFVRKRKELVACKMCKIIKMYKRHPKINEITTSLTLFRLKKNKEKAYYTRRIFVAKEN